MSRWVACLSLLALAALPTPASAATSDFVPSQATMDGGPGSSSLSGGTWADLAGGVSDRPYVKELAVVNGQSADVVYSGGAAGQGPTASGDLTAVISPINLCKTGQSSGCYSTPNRVGVQLGYIDGMGGVHRDLGNPTVPLNQTITADTVIDLTIGLNVVGAPLRWTGATGALEGWKTTALGSTSGEIRIRLRPAITPEIDWAAHPGPNGCTATPISDCEIQQADGESRTAGLVLSLDNTLPTSLTGAVFATQQAIMGFLQPTGTPDAPALDFQLASSHLRADGSPQLGTLRAFLPAAGLFSYYGMTPDGAAAALGTERRGDPGTSTAPELAVHTAGAFWDDGLVVTVGSITFSAPTYRLATRSSLGTSPTGSTAPTPTATPAPNPAPASVPAKKGDLPAPETRLTTASRKRGIALAISGAKPGTARATLLVGKRALAKGTAKISATGTATLRLKPTKKWRAVRKAKLRLEIPGQAPRTIGVKLS